MANHDVICQEPTSIASSLFSSISKTTQIVKEFSIKHIMWKKLFSEVRYPPIKARLLLASARKSRILLRTNHPSNSKAPTNFFHQHGAKNAVTLFHNPSNAGSTRILSLLQRSAGPVTENSAEKSKEQPKFTLDVNNGPPTGDQLKSILEYVGAGRAGDIVEGASDEADAQRRLRGNPSAFKRPLVVDWNAGKVIVGEKESEVESLLKKE
jgi:arsenate reductase-like glutaredoxin family protein